MYINPFWAGVLTTIVVEVLVFIAWVAIYAGKNNRK